MSTPQLSAPGPEISKFEGIKHHDEQGREYWNARELMTILGYKRWENFERPVNEAIAVCLKEGQDSVDFNFRAITKNKSDNDDERGRKGDDYILTRHACYLIAESCDGRKSEVAWAKIYFAFTTERYELLAQNDEDRRRIESRQKLALHQTELALRAQMAGASTTTEYQAVFNAGLRGLYDGETAAAIRKRRGLKPGTDIYDHMGSLEIAANDMRAALAIHHIDTRGVDTVAGVAQTHNEAGRSVRQFLLSEGVEIKSLPMPTKSYEQLLKEQAMRELLAEQDRTGLWSLLPAEDEDEKE